MLVGRKCCITHILAFDSLPQPRYGALQISHFNIPSRKIISNNYNGIRWKGASNELHFGKYNYNYKTKQLALPK